MDTDDMPGWALDKYDANSTKKGSNDGETRNNYSNLYTIGNLS